MRRLHRVLVLPVTVICSATMLGCANFDGHAPSDSSSLLGASERSPADTALAARPSSAMDRDPDEGSDTSLGFSDFSPSNIGATIKELAGQGPDQQVAQELYEEAEDIYNKAIAARGERVERVDDDTRDMFVQASNKYAAAAGRWPNSALEENALFRAGESMFFADRYVQANEHFEELLENYPNSRYLDWVGARRFEIAQYWIDLDTADGSPLISLKLENKERPWSDTFGHAIRVYDRMRLDDPTGKLADDATIAAANAYFIRGNYVDADQYYTDLRRNFPSSEHQFMAHYLGIQAKLRGYRGPEYTGEVLDEAEKLVKQIRRQFPTEYRRREAEVEKAYREIRYRQAEREWNLVEYYHFRRQYGAARFYCDLIVKEFPDTPFAEKARLKMVECAGKPRTPPQRLAWLVELFPDGKPPEPEMSTPGSDTKRR
ncbi:MAG: outer membrane protein assembly factor BamD [Planctomycetota bacterium]